MILVYPLCRFLPRLVCLLVQWEQPTSAGFPVRGYRLILAWFSMLRRAAVSQGDRHMQATGKLRHTTATEGRSVDSFQCSLLINFQEYPKLCGVRVPRRLVKQPVLQTKTQKWFHAPAKPQLFMNDKRFTHYSQLLTFEHFRNKCLHWRLLFEPQRCKCFTHVLQIQIIANRT